MRPLRQHSLLILLLVGVAAVGGLLAALLFGHLLPYEAEAVLLFKAGSSDRLVLTGNADFEATVLDANRQTRNLQALISSLDVAEKVSESARTNDVPEVSALGSAGIISLRKAIQVEVKGDLIYVRAKADTPEVATWLANAWGAESVAKINRLYALSSSRVSEALDDAQSELTASQTALQQFLADNPINTLNQELAQTASFITSTTATYTNTQFILYNAEREALQQNLASAYASVYSIDQIAGEIRALRTRVEQSPDQPDALYGNQISLLVIQNKLAAGGVQTDVQLQFSVTGAGSTSLTKAGQLLEVDATLAAAQKLQDDLRLQIEDLDGKLRAPLPPLAPDAIADVPDSLLAQVRRKNQLESELEARTFEYDQLQKTRDLRQSTYDLLRNRLAEQQVNELISRIVDVASPANELEAAGSRSLLRSSAVLVGQAILLAAALGIALAYLLYLWRPTFSANAALERRLRSSARVAPANSDG